MGTLESPLIMQTYLTEFANFPVDPVCIALLGMGFVDASWHNDSCPSFEGFDLKVWVEYADPEQREFGPDAERFGISYASDGQESGSMLSTNEWNEVLGFIASYRAEREGLPPFMLREIKTTADADAFIRAANKSGHLWHMDDTATLIDTFTRAEKGALQTRQNEVHGLRLTEGYDPHAMCLFVSNGMPDAWLQLDEWFASSPVYGPAGLSAEQRDCLTESARIEEARDMLDDMQARLGVPPSLVALCLIALDESRAWE